MAIFNSYVKLPEGNPYTYGFISISFHFWMELHPQVICLPNPHRVHGLYGFQDTAPKASHLS